MLPLAAECPGEYPENIDGQTQKEVVPSTNPLRVLSNNQKDSGVQAGEAYQDVVPRKDRLEVLVDVLIKLCLGGLIHELESALVVSKRVLLLNVAFF